MPHFHEFDEPIGEIGTVGDFWRWAMSDLLSNSTRGVLAEYIVGRLLEIDFDQPRLEWDAYDLLYNGRRIEVKSSAYVQTWHKPDSNDPNRILVLHSISAGMPGKISRQLKRSTLRTPMYSAFFPSTRLRWTTIS
jgi:hypothetical protein